MNGACAIFPNWDVHERFPPVVANFTTPHGRARNGQKHCVIDSSFLPCWRMNEDPLADSSPVAKPEREAVEGRLDLRSHHLTRTRYRLLNLRDCVAPKADDEDAEAIE